MSVSNLLTHKDDNILISVIACLDPLPTIINATKQSSTGNLYGDVQGYSCHDGHQLPDSNSTLTVTCLASNGMGLWSVPSYSACQGMSPSNLLLPC